MAIHCYDDKSGSLYGYLVDGDLPKRSILAQTAEEIAQQIETLPKEKQDGLLKRPFTWAHWDEDTFFEFIAYNTRGMFHRDRPRECMKYTWSEAWLLKPNQLEEGYDLVGGDKNQPSRRFLVTLYDGCKQGKQCLTNLVDRSGLKVISGDQYKDFSAFERESEKLLEDISLPFKAPCIIAGEKIAQNGYEYRAFGN